MALVRVGSPLPFPTFAGACERLRASGLPMSPRDWFCQPQPWTAHASFVGALLLMGIGVILPTVVLAASGRRLTAFLPLVAAPWIGWSTNDSTTWWQTAAWPRDGLQVALVNAALLVAPAAAIVLVRRRRNVRQPMLSLVAAVAGGLPCVAAAAGIFAAAQAAQARHFESVGGVISSQLILPAAVCMGLFGLILGTDRRWWPWSLAPVALLLSAGPSVALLSGPSRWVDWSPFGYAIPLTAIGLVCSFWRPLATWLTPRLRRTRPGSETATLDARERSGGRRVGRTVVMNAIAVGLLSVSWIMFVADPLPANVSASLPTYLGVRVAAQDLRTKLDLRQAVAAMDAYRAAHGTYLGFDAADGAHAAPSLAWTDGVRPDASEREPYLTMSVVSATDRRARVAAVSASGTAFCLERVVGGELSFGSSEAMEPVARLAMKQSIENCGAVPWTAAATRPLETERMCDGLDPESGYLLCRMVQVVIADTLAQTKPTPS
jgi:hypothetical protein